MGKGGENQQVPRSRVFREKIQKISHLDDEVLRKWAKQYGEKADGSRDDLLDILAPYADGILDPDRPKFNLPLEKPKFTMADIRNSIPAHCFKRNLWISLSHLISDLSIIAVLAYLATYINTPAVPTWAKYVLWPLYCYAQGAVMTGVWVLAHECGHESFSESDFWNNVFGTVLHSALLVPYHSWRITHRRHHGNTGSCEDDEVFAPSTRSDWAKEMLRETPLAQAWGIFIMLSVGWMPGYLVFNATGPKKYAGKDVNHFSPSAAFFEASEYWLIVQSDIAWIIAFAALVYSIYTFGITNVGLYYLIPYAITNYHLVLITYLQHTDVYMPHFRGEEFSWLRGALCTVDRSFGPILDHTFHHITDTHVCHHIFSKMPFYHAQEATEAFKKVLGPYYLKDETPIARAVYRSYSTCQFVEDSGDIVFYKNVK